MALLRLGLLAILMLGVVVTAAPAAGGDAAPGGGAGALERRAGWFHIVWNGGPHFVLVDEQGSSIRLSLDESVARPHGGPRALNRKRVTVTGTPLGGAPETFRVLAIQVES